MAAGLSYTDPWGAPPRIDLDEELAAHDDGRHDAHPTPNTCPAC